MTKYSNIDKHRNKYRVRFNGKIISTCENIESAIEERNKYAIANKSKIAAATYFKIVLENTKKYKNHFLPNNISYNKRDNRFIFKYKNYYKTGFKTIEDAVSYKEMFFKENNIEYLPRCIQRIGGKYKLSFTLFTFKPMYIGFFDTLDEAIETKNKILKSWSD